MAANNDSNIIIAESAFPNVNFYQWYTGVYFYTMPADELGNKYCAIGNSAGSGKTRTMAAMAIPYIAERERYNLHMMDDISDTPTYDYIIVYSTSKDHRANTYAEFLLVLGAELMQHVSFYLREDKIPTGRVLIFMDESQSYINNRGAISSSIADITNRDDLSIVVASATPWTNSLTKGDSIRTMFGGSFEGPGHMVTFIPPLTRVVMQHWGGMWGTAELQKEGPIDMSRVTMTIDISIAAVEITNLHLEMYHEAIKRHNIAELRASSASLSLAMASGNKDPTYSLHTPVVRNAIATMGVWAAMPYIAPKLAMTVKVHQTRPGKLLFGVFFVEVLLEDFSILLREYGYYDMRIGPGQYTADRHEWYYLVVKSIIDIDFLATLGPNVNVIMIASNRFLQTYSYPWTSTIVKGDLRYNDAANSQTNARIVRYGTTMPEVVIVDLGSFYFDENHTIVLGHEYGVLQDQVLAKRSEIGPEIRALRELNIFKDMLPALTPTPLDPYIVAAPEGKYYPIIVGEGDYHSVFAIDPDFEILYSQLLAMIPLSSADYPQKKFVEQKKKHMLHSVSDPRYTTFSGSLNPLNDMSDNINIAIFKQPSDFAGIMASFMGILSKTTPSQPVP